MIEKLQVILNETAVDLFKLVCRTVVVIAAIALTSSVNHFSESFLGWLDWWWYHIAQVISGLFIIVPAAIDVYRDIRIRWIEANEQISATYERKGDDETG